MYVYTSKMQSITLSSIVLHIALNCKGILMPKKKKKRRKFIGVPVVRTPGFYC